MKRAEKAARIVAILDELLPEIEVPLDHADPFTLLVAVLLSAQTTDARVNQVTPGLFALAATPEDMAELGAERILAEIRTCGLAPSKAKNLAALSRRLVDEHGGRVPASFEALEDLPGVGHKTASVVMAQAFGVPAFPVDTHIHRLAARWGLSSGESVERTERDLKAVFPRERWNDLHLAIILFGRRFCPARGHDLAACPICSWAASQARVAAERARARGGAAELLPGMPAKRRAAAVERPAATRAAREPARRVARKGSTAPRNASDGGSDRASGGASGNAGGGGNGGASGARGSGARGRGRSGR